MKYEETLKKYILWETDFFQLFLTNNLYFQSRTRKSADKEFLGKSGSQGVKFNILCTKGIL